MWRLFAWTCVRRSLFQDALDTIAKARAIFEGQLTHLQYLGHRERITTYQQWIRELKKEFEDVEYLRRENGPSRIWTTVETESRPKARIVGGELFELEDANYDDSILRLAFEAQYRVYRVSCVELDQPKVAEGDLALVQELSDTDPQVSEDDVLAILVEARRDGITVRRIRKPGVPAAGDKREQVVGRVISYLKKAA